MARDPGVEARLISQLDLIDAAQAGATLGLATEGVEAEMSDRVQKGQLIRLSRGDDVLYPRFQFDATRGRVFPVVANIIRILPSHKSNLWLCHWLTRPHVQFGSAPAAVFGQRDDAVLAALARELEERFEG